ncbi:DEAD/DEAH box helicase family protein [Streptomyces sp. NPDC058751]|uniref:DEAD/DEAH box helicase family protein n=1 Tax=Streptomyces sp. NPDC058751 TaxID=3346623 RepID=UPI0036C261F2
MPNRIINALSSLVETKGIRRPWREELHPRDSKGRFIETGGVARVWGGGFARIVRALSMNDILVSNLDGSNQRKVVRQRLTMVARPDGSAPTKNEEKVQAEDARRDADPRRGDGINADDNGDPDSSDDPHDTDDEGQPIGEDDDAEPKDEKGSKKAPRFTSVTAARNHLESGKKDQRWKRPPRAHNGVHLRGASKQERAQVRIDTYSATGGLDFARTSQLSSDGNFLVTRHGNGKWDVYHIGSGTIMTHQAGFRSKPDALHFANELENAWDDRGRPFDWEAPHVADRLDMANGRDGIDAAIARGRERNANRDSSNEHQAQPAPVAEQPQLGDAGSDGDVQDEQQNDTGQSKPTDDDQSEPPAQQEGDDGPLSTVAQVLDHWRNNPDVPRLRETHNERRQREAVARQRADLVTDPQVVDGFLIGRMEVKGKQRWTVFHVGTSVPIAILAADKGKPDAIARAHTYRDYRDEQGQPFDWSSDGIGARLDSPAGKRMREATSGRTSHEPGRHENDVPDGATELASFPGYRMARGEDGTNVYGPDGKRIATGQSVFDRNTRRSAYVGNVGDRHVSGRTETDFAVNAARQHTLAGQPDDQKDPMWVQYSPSRAVVHGADRNDPDMHKRLRRAGFVWSDGAQAYVTTSNTRPVTRALAVDGLVRGLAAEGRQIEVRRDEDRLRTPAAPQTPAAPKAPEAPPADVPNADAPEPAAPDLRSLDDAELEDYFTAANQEFHDVGFSDQDRMVAAQDRAKDALEEMQRRDRLKYDEDNARRARVEPFDGKRYPVTIDGDDSDDASLQGSNGAWTWNRLGGGSRYSSEKSFRTREAALADLISERDRDRGQEDKPNGPEAPATTDADEQHTPEAPRPTPDAADANDAADAPYGQDGAKTYLQVKDEIAALQRDWNSSDLARDLGNGQDRQLTADLNTSFRYLAATTGIRQRIQASRELRRSAEAVLAALDDDPGRDPYGRARLVLEAIRDRTARHEQRLDATLKSRNGKKKGQPAKPAAVPSAPGTDNQSAPDTTTTGDDSSGSEQTRADRREALADVPAEGVRGAGDGAGEGDLLRDARDSGGSGDRRQDTADPGAADEREVRGPGGGQDAGQSAGQGDRDERADLPAGRARHGERRASGSRQAVAARAFRPASQKDLAPSGEKARARANVAAVRTLRQIQAEDRSATPAEQKILARWSGWGALPIVLADKPEPTDGAFRDADGNPDPAKYARALKKWESFAEERAAVRELLNDEEWAAARANTLNAHYTDHELVQPLWNLVRELGFDGGNVLEPGSGSGNFIGSAPENARMTGIELDPTTAAISQLLYPDARIINDSFGDVRMPNSYFDLAIGNVPFGRFPMYDAQVNPDNKHSIHDTFILKSLQKVRPGGLVAVVTSRYTMDGEDDTARRQMSYMADLVGAVRLPAGAHQDAAGTGVVTDMLVFRRRFGDENTHDIDMSWTRSSKTNVNGHEIAVNDYFQQHPKMILGQLTTGRGQFSDHDLTVVGDKNAGPALKAGLERIRSASYMSRERPNRMRYVPEIDAVDRHLELAGEKHEGAVHILSDGKFTQVEDGAVIPLDVHPTQQEQLRKLIALRETTNRLLRLEGSTRESGETDDMRALRRKLNEAYDAYVKQHGPIDKPGQTRFFSPQEAKDRAKAEGLKDVPDAWKQPSALQLFEDDPASAVVFGLDKWDDSAKSAKKADIFRQRVLAPREIANRADSPEQAIALAQELDGGELHLPTIARLLRRTDLQVLREEIGPLAFDEPGSNRLVSRGEYLSGNVREKLALAEKAAAADPRFAANVAALKNVIPRDLDPSEIKVKMGAPWIPETDITAFLQHILGTKAVRAERGGASMWEVQGPTTGIAARSDWGTKAKPAPEIAKALLEQRTIVVTRSIEAGGKKVTVTDDEATSEAQAKAKEMAERFSEWVWEDPERTKRLARVYNDTFNNLVMREFDDSPLALPGANAEWTMRPHQNAAIRRIVSEKSVLLAHVVGAGKTATMVAGTQELRRTGMARKPAIVVPNHMLGQFRREYLELYPDAKLLTASSTDLTGKKRRRFIAKAATGDWDAVILTQGAFERIPMRAEAQEKYMRRELDRLQEEITRAKQREGKSLTLKRLEETLKQKEAKLKQKLAAKKDAGTVHFEDTGIDYLMVDEAHGYKNLATASHIEGAAIPGSAKASDLHMKIEYLRERNESGRVVTLATGTPIANSVTEAYVMQRFLRPDVLEAAGVNDFDSWAATFGEIVQNLELAPDGSGFRMKARFSRFHNAAELLRMYRLAVDVQTAADLNLPTPKVRAGADGKRGEVVTVPISAEQKAFVTALPSQPWIHKQGGVLKAIGLASRAAIDMRLVGGHGEEGGKIDAAVHKIAEIYEENKDRIYPVSDEDSTPQKLPGSLQIVFMDASTPGSTAKNAWDGYAYMKEQLVEAGVPADKVRFIHEAKTDKAKAKLFEDAKNGKIAVLIGSTEKMGTGANIQTRAVALHHMDFPWRPADMAQREGRIERQGNLNMPEIPGTADDVRILSYVTEETFDAFKLGTLERKAGFIAQMDRKDFDAREMEDIGDVAVSFGQMKAIATGDMTVMDYAQAGADVVELQRADRRWHRDQDTRRRTVAAADGIISDLAEVLPAWRDALERREDVSGDNFRIRIGDEEYDQRADAYDDLAQRVQEAAWNMSLQDGTRVPLGHLGGHNFHVEIGHDQFGNRVAKVRFDWPSWEHPAEPDTRGVYTPSQLVEASGRGILASLERRLNNLDEAIADAETSLEIVQDERARALRGLGGTSPHGELLRSKERRVALLSNLITANEKLKGYKGREVDPNDEGYLKAKRRVAELKDELGIEDRREHEIDEAAAAAALSAVDDDAVTLDADEVDRELAKIRPEGAARTPRTRSGASSVNERRESSSTGRAGTVTLDRDQVDEDLESIRPAGGNAGSGGSSEPPTGPGVPPQGDDDDDAVEPLVGTISPRAMTPEGLQAEIVALIEHEMAHGPLVGAAKTRLAALEAEKDRRAGKRPERETKPKPTPQRSGPGGNWADLTRDQVEGDEGEDDGLFSTPATPTGPSRAADPSNPLDKPDDPFGTPDMFADAEGRDTADLREAEIRRADQLKQGDRFADADGRVHTVAEPPAKTGRGRVRVVTEEGRELFFRPADEVRLGDAAGTPQDGGQATQPTPERQEESSAETTDTPEVQPFAHNKEWRDALAPVDVADTLLGAAASETWRLSEVPDSISRIRRGVMNAIAALEDNDFDAAEQSLMDAREQATGLQDSLLRTERDKVGEPLRVLIGAIDTFLARHQVTRERRRREDDAARRLEQQRPDSSSAVADDAEVSSLFTRNKADNRGAVDSLKARYQEQFGSEPRDRVAQLSNELFTFLDQQWGEAAGDVFGPASETALHLADALHDQEMTPEERSGRFGVQVGAIQRELRARRDRFSEPQADTPPVPVPPAAREWNNGDWAVTPNGEGRVILAEDGKVVVLDGGGAPRTYEPRQLSLPGEARTAEHNAPTAQEAARAEKRQQDLDAAQTPEGLRLFYGTRLANLDLEEGHGQVLDEGGNTVGWIRRRGTVWLGQDARGGQAHGGAAQSDSDPLHGPREAAQAVDSRRRDDGMSVALKDTTWRHLTPEEGKDEVWYSEFSDAQQNEFFKLTKEWAKSSDPELSKAAQHWGRGGLNYRQMNRLADEAAATADGVDATTPEGRRRQAVLRRLADKIRAQARRAWRGWQTMPPAGEPDVPHEIDAPDWVPFGHRETSEADAPVKLDAEQVRTELDGLKRDGASEESTPATTPDLVTELSGPYSDLERALRQQYGDDLPRAAQGVIDNWAKVLSAFAAGADSDVRGGLWGAMGDAHHLYSIRPREGSANDATSEQIHRFMRAAREAEIRWSGDAPGEGEEWTTLGELKPGDVYRKPGRRGTTAVHFSSEPRQDDPTRHTYRSVHLSGEPGGSMGSDYPDERVIRITDDRAVAQGKRSLSKEHARQRKQDRDLEALRAERAARRAKLAPEEEPANSADGAPETGTPTMETPDWVDDMGDGLWLDKVRKGAGPRNIYVNGLIEALVGRDRSTGDFFWWRPGGQTGEGRYGSPEQAARGFAADMRDLSLPNLASLPSVALHTEPERTPSTPDDGPDADTSSVDEPNTDESDDDNGEDDSAGRDRRQRRRRDRRDRDRNRPQGGGLGRPLIPHIPERDNRNNGDDSDSSGLDGLRDDYRTGRQLLPSMDTPEHRDFLRRLADNPTLTRSVDGGLVTWSDDHAALADGQPALWYFAHARTGAGLGGAGNTAVSAYSGTQARELANRYERLSDANGTPFDWAGDLDPVAVRAWRDGQGRNLPQAMRAERDAFEAEQEREEPSALPADLSHLTDPELESLPHQDFTAEDWERYAAEMDRRFPPADQLRNVLQEEPPATEEEREAENKAMDAALGFGQTDVAPEIVRAKRLSRDEQLRDEYQVWHEERRNRAETAMRGGSMLSKEGKRSGYSEDDVFNGGFLSANDAWRKYASDELIEWFDQNGGRVTYNQFREQKRQSERLDRWEWEEQQRATRGEADASGDDTADVDDSGPVVDEPEEAAAGEVFDASKPRFSDVAALREHLKAGEFDAPGPGGNWDMLQRLDEVIASKKLEMSPGGRLAIGPFKHNNRRGKQWRILAPGSMKTLFDPYDISREQAIAYTEALEGIRDRDGNPFPWDAPDAAMRAHAFRGPDGENLTVAIAKAFMDKFVEEEPLYHRTTARLLLLNEQRLDEHYPRWRAASEQDGYTIPVYHPDEVQVGDEVDSFRVWTYADTPGGGPAEWSERGVATDTPNYLTRNSIGQGLDFPFGVMGDYQLDIGRGPEEGKFDLAGNKVDRLVHGVHLVADPVRARAMRRPRPGETAPEPEVVRDEDASARKVPDAVKPAEEVSTPNVDVPENQPQPEPIGGRTAEWVSVSDLGLGDVVRIEGATRTGKPRILSGYVIQAPQRRAVSRKGRSTEMFMTLVSETRDGSSGDRSPVWTPLDASAARATGEPDNERDRADSSLITGAEGDVLTGNIADRIATDSSGRGLFPGSLVQDNDGRDGVVTGANSSTVSVRFGDDKQETGLAPTSVTVTDGGAARPTGWTPEGQRVRDGHVVSDRDGNMLGTVEGVDGDTAQVATREGIKPMPVTDLRTVGEVRDSGPNDAPNTTDVVPTTAGALNEGDVIVDNGEDGPRTVTVVGRDADGDQVQLDVADTRTGETSQIDTTADAPMTRLVGEDGQAPAAGDEDDDIDLRVLEEPQAVDPVIGDTVDPQLSPEERNAIADHGAAPTDDPDVQQAVTRIGEDLPVTPGQATALADALRATSTPDTAEGRAARRAAGHLDEAAGRTTTDSGALPAPGTVNDLGVGDTIALPDENDENNVSSYTVARIDDLLGGARQVTVQDTTGAQHSRVLAGDQPLWQLPELPAADGADTPRRDPNLAPSADDVVAGHPHRVARAVVDSAIAGTEPAGSIHQLRQQVAERVTSEALLTHMQQARQDAVDALNAVGVTGPERAEAFKRLKAERLRARAAAVKAVLRTINDLEPLDGESEQDTANRAADLLRMIPDQIGAPSAGQGSTGETEETIGRHVDDALMTLARQAFGDGLSNEDALRLGRVLAGRMDATRQATARRILRHLPPAQRQRLLPQVLALLMRIGRRIIAMVKALLKAAGRVWNAEAFRRFRERLVARVKAWPESRRLHRITQSADLPNPGDGDSLADRIAHWTRLLPAPGRFGQTSRRARWYQRTTRRALAAGELPAVQDGMRWAPDQAADRGPGATAMRHLAALRAAGGDMDRDINARLAAARPELGDDPHTSLRLASAYADITERRARDLAAHPVGHSVNPEYALELAAARAEAADARAEADRLRAAYVAALPDVVADALGSVREMGPGGASALIVSPDSDSDAARALTNVQRFVPRDWLDPAERRLVSARSAEVGGYDPASRTVSVADLGDEGLGTAVYALLVHLQQAQPDLLAAQQIYRYARTHRGRIGARRSSVDELFARLFSSSESGRADVILPRALQSLFNGDWYEDDDLRAFLLGLLATR